MLFHSMKQSLLFCQIILVILATEFDTWFIKLIMSMELTPQPPLDQDGDLKVPLFDL